MKRSLANARHRQISAMVKSLDHQHRTLGSKIFLRSIELLGQMGLERDYKPNLAGPGERLESPW